MSIKRNLRDLLATPGPGTEPDKDNWLARQVFTAWHETAEAKRGEHVRQSTAPFWASDGATCARKLSYSLLERAGLAEPTNPPDIASIWRFHLGDVVHEDVQSSLPTDEHEVRAVLKDDDGNDFVSCRADTIIPFQYEDEANGPVPADGVAAVEIKSMNGFGFKMSATTFKGPAEGPRWSAVVQLALTVKALIQQGRDDITHGIILLVALENVSPNMAKDFADSEIARFSAQFTYTAEELVAIADDIIPRLLNIRRVVVEEASLAPRVINDPEIPKAARIVNPTTGAWELHDRDGGLIRAGTTWVCGYCDWRDQCKADGA